MIERAIVAFPASRRIAFTEKVARSIANASTQRDAIYRLNRTVISMRGQMERAGIAPNEVERQVNEFLISLRSECVRMKSTWLPRIPESDRAS